MFVETRLERMLQFKHRVNAGCTIMTRKTVKICCAETNFVKTLNHKNVRVKNAANWVIGQNGLLVLSAGMMETTRFLLELGSVIV